MHSTFHARQAVGILALVATYASVGLAQGEQQAMATLRMPESRAFTLTEPNFFLTGAGEAACHNCSGDSESLNQIRFRVALRYRLAGSADANSQNGLYFTYRQNSFWHLYEFENSAPFFDNNYAPGAVGYYELDRQSTLSPAIRVFVQHESNGRDGAASRSWNQVGGGLDLGDPEKSRVYATAVAWMPLGIAAENADLPDLAGRGEVKVFVQPWRRQNYRLDQRGLSVAVRTLGKRAVGNVEVAGYWGVGRPSAAELQPRFTPSLMLHLFHGYAENLLTYQERRTAVRVGVAFIR